MGKSSGLSFKMISCFKIHVLLTVITIFISSNSELTAISEQVVLSIDWADLHKKNSILIFIIYISNGNLKVKFNIPRMQILSRARSYTDVIFGSYLVVPKYLEWNQSCASVIFRPMLCELILILVTCEWFKI